MLTTHNLLVPKYYHHDDPHDDGIVDMVLCRLNDKQKINAYIIMCIIVIIWFLGWLIDYACEIFSYTPASDLDMSLGRDQSRLAKIEPRFRGYGAFNPPPVYQAMEEAPPTYDEVMKATVRPS